MQSVKLQQMTSLSFKTCTVKNLVWTNSSYPNAVSKNGKMIATDLMMPTATAAAAKNRAPLEVYDWRRRG